MMDLESVEVNSVIPLMPTPDLVPCGIVEDIGRCDIRKIQSECHIEPQHMPRFALPLCTQFLHHLGKDSFEHKNRKRNPFNSRTAAKGAILFVSPISVDQDALLNMSPAKGIVSSNNIQPARPAVPAGRTICLGSETGLQ